MLYLDTVEQYVQVVHVKDIGVEGFISLGEMENMSMKDAFYSLRECYFSMLAFVSVVLSFSLSVFFNADIVRNCVRGHCNKMIYKAL